MAYIEPCCAERQLPQLLREAKGVALFQTSGDVTIEKMMRSVGCMVGQPSEMWLLTKEIDVKTLRMIRYWFQRGWINRLRLMTGTDQSKTVSTELADVNSIDWQALGFTTPEAAVEYAQDDTMSAGLLAFTDGRNTVVLQGEMLTEAKFGLRMYVGIFASATDSRVADVMSTVRARLKVRMKKKTETAVAEQPPTTSESPAEEQPASKPKRARKKKTE